MGIRHSLRIHSFCIALVHAAACSGDPDNVTDARPTSSAESIDWNALDETVDPCSDFYHYACGTWQRMHPLSSAGSYRRRFDDAFYALTTDLQAILKAEVAGERADDDPYARVVSTFYTSCLNAPDNTQSRQELSQLLATVMAINSWDDLAWRLGGSAKIGSGALFRATVGADPIDPTRRVLVLDQGGVELQNRDDYLADDREELRADYRQHIRDLSRFFPAVKIDADAVVAIETALARAYRSPEDRRDARMLYHPMSRAELAALTPKFPFDKFFEAAGYPTPMMFQVTEPEYFEALDKLLQNTSLSDFKSYLAWQLLQDKVRLMDRELVELDFRFWSQHYTGQPEQPPRDWTCYNATLSSLGMALSQVYVARNFDDAARDAVSTLVSELRSALAARLDDAGWLDDPTRAEAMAKLDAVDEVIGYPDQWPDYAALDLLQFGSYFSNYIQITQAFYGRRVASLNARVDRREWTMTPITVNASYMPAQNTIQVPAAMLALPFYSSRNPPVSNYGAIGYVLGHELTHGFDDSGRTFDGQGALRDWWTTDTESAFRDRAECLVEQFSTYQVPTREHVNGHLTLGENIADLGGLLLALDAFEQNQASASKTAHGHTPRQQFFLAYAQLYCENARPEWLRQNVMTDQHAPAVQRVNGTLVNVPAFADAYECHKPAPSIAAISGQDRCEVW